jgi:hypothetical protein
MATNKDAQGKTVALELDKLTLDKRCSPRALAPDPQTVQAYYEGIVDGSIDFPPLAAVSDGTSYWLVDGYLRLAAFRLAGRSHVEVRVVPGGLREARLLAASMNAAHGKQRTNEDKRKQVWSLLTLLDEEGSVNQWSAQQIARHCLVGGPLVNTLKRLFLEEKAAWRKKQEEAEQAEAALAEPPADNGEEPHPEAEFIPAPAPAPALPPEDDDLDEVDRHDREVVKERWLRAIRKVDRFSALLGRTTEELLSEYRAEQAEQAAAAARREAEEARHRKPPKPEKAKTIWDD